MIAFATTASLVMIAAVCSAVQDTVRDHFGQSIFAGLSPKWRDWWHSEWSYVKQRRKDGWPTQLADGWHAMKTVKLTAWLGLPVAARHVMDADVLYEIGGALVLGLVWIVTFNLFYDHILLT